MTKMRHDNDISDHIGPLYAGKKYNCYDQSDKVLFMMKFKQNNDVTGRIGMAYAEIETELSWPIKQDAVYHEKQTRQRHDQSYGTDYAENETKLLWPIGQGAVYEENQTRQWCD